MKEIESRPVLRTYVARAGSADYVSLIGAHQDGLIGTHLSDMPNLVTA